MLGEPNMRMNNAICFVLWLLLMYVIFVVSPRYQKKVTAKAAANFSESHNQAILEIYGQQFAQ